MEHDDIMALITSCETADQLKEVEDFIRYDRHLGIGLKQFYFGKIKNQMTMLPVTATLTNNNIKFNARRLI